MAKRMYTLDEPDDAIATLEADHQRSGNPSNL